MGADTIIGVDLNAGYPRRKPKNIIEVLLRSFELTLKTATKMQAEKADVLIEPDLSSFNMVDITQKEELMERGYQQAMDVLKV
jgi:NTE family protein